MAKTLGYNKTRPTNARGFLKITSVTTNQPIADNEGNSLANRTINWNDSNNADWYENFIDIINASLTSTSKIQDPMASMVLSGIENYLYEINQSDASRAVSFSFEAPVSGANRRFEAVRTEFKDDKIIEAEPIETKKFTIINRNDNLGPASDRTGFFVYAKTGKLNFENFTYNTKVSNLIETIASANISNTDVWVQRVDTTNTYSSSVTKVDNDTRETAIYNSLRNGNGDIVSVNTIDNNAVELHYGDGVFGNAASGNYRVWFRTTDNENYRVDRNDVNEKVISIPYTGADKKNYRLVLTLSSTRDFSENFAAESYTSVRRVAPRSYYSQDRMVNAQDYNVLPLSLGSNIISKVKAVNTTFAGNSRYFEMDDVTGHHSNISITGTDGGVYSDTDAITMKLSFNRQNGNTTDFVRNEITKALGHHSLINLFYEINNEESSDPESVNYSLQNSVSFTTDVKDRKMINIDQNSNPESSVWPGDFLKLNFSDTGENQWVKVQYGEETSPVTALITNNKLRVTSRIGRNEGDIVSIVRGYRTRLEADEINEIKNKIAESEEKIIIKYVKTNDFQYYKWKIHDDVNSELDPNNTVFIELTYNSGLRESEAEYKVKFTGKKIVFASNNDVKFYYSNEDLIVNNETNLANRDSILINYLTNTNNAAPADLPEATVTIGYGKITDFNEGDRTFKANYPEASGAPNNWEFFYDRGDVMLTPHTTTYHIVSNDNQQYDLTSGEVKTSGGIIGETGEGSELYFKSFELNSLDSIPGKTDVIKDDTITEVSENDLKISESYLTAETPWASSASSKAVTISVDHVDLSDINGEASVEYFSAASNKNKFLFFNEDKITLVPNELESGDDGVSSKYSVLYIDDDNDDDDHDGYYTFRIDGRYYDQMQLDVDSEEGDTDPGYADVRWKQIAFAKLSFESTLGLTLDELVVKQSDGGTVIENKHLQFKSDGVIGTSNIEKYSIIFWTFDPGIGEKIDIFRTNGAPIDFENDYRVRVDTKIKFPKNLNITTAQTYSTTETYTYDKFITPETNIDNSKIKISHMDSKNNPFGIINIYKSDLMETSSIVLEEYEKNGIGTFEKISDNASAASDTKVYDDNGDLDLEKTIPARPNKFNNFKDTTNIAFDSTNQKWYKRSSNEGTEWEEIQSGIEYIRDSDNVEIKSHATITDSGEEKTYRVVDGRSYIEDEFMSFRWDHFVDADKRIDPSTSNIIDMYVLTEDYVRNIDEWIRNGFGDIIPTPPNNFELRKIMESLEDKTAIADHVSYIPVKFKMLFGSYAELENQAIFKVIPKLGTTYTNSEIKNIVAAKVNEYFKLENWDFGDKFYFSELAAYLHQELADYISSVVITPKYAGNDFKNLLSINSELHEIFLSVVTSNDVKIISSITDKELAGE